MTEQGLRYAIVEYTTNKHFCNIYDAIKIERLQWELVRYDRDQHKHLDRAICYVPVGRCKLLVHHILTGFYMTSGWKVEVFGGSERDGKIESRVFKVEYDPGQDNAYTRFPFRLSIAVGQGKRTATNGIAPVGQPIVQVNARIPEDDFTGICLEIRDFLLVHQRDLETVRGIEQQANYERRLDEQDRRQVEPERPAARPELPRDRREMYRH